MSALFVYGTLMRDGGRAPLLGDVRRRPARARALLYDLPAGYPAITPGAADVFGELVEPVSDAALSLLDAYEGVDEGLYRRVRIEVRVDTEHVSAWAYVMDHPERRGGRRIRSGRWEPMRRR